METNISHGLLSEIPISWCENLGYLSPRWKKHYPRLASVLQDQPLLPMGNVMKNNIFIDCREPFHLTQDVKPEWLTRENNPIWKRSDFTFLPEPGSSAPLDAVPGRQGHQWPAEQ